jgi:RNA polymerase sigma factor (sigma-70 family)
MDRADWQQTYEEAFPRVYRALVALGARPDEAEDALHDAFERALHEHAIARVDGWLFVVASRRWRRRRVREAFLRPLSVVRERPADPPPEEWASVLRELPRLSLRQRQVLVARYVLGLSQEETAQALGIARGTVAATATQAAAALRRRLEER